jgi:hypothetical protein
LGRTIAYGTSEYASTAMAKKPETTTDQTTEATNPSTEAVAEKPKTEYENPQDLF